MLIWLIIITKEQVELCEYTVLFFFAFDLNWYFDLLREIAAPFDCSSSQILADSTDE